MRRIAILAEGAFEWHYGKTATGVIRYGKDPVVAVIDSTKAGKDVSQALGSSIGVGIPVVHDIHEALKYQPDTLLIGIAPMGGALPQAWRWQLLTAIDAGLDLVSGLHFFLSDDGELRAAAEKRGTTIWDVRRPPDKNRVAQFLPHRPGSHTILLVGSDCATGKMSTALEIDREASSRGLNSAFVATGQTGMGLIHGSMPDAMIFCHKAGETAIEGYTYCPLPPLKRMIEINEDTVSWVRPERPCKVVGLSIITFGLSEQEARDTLKRAEDETGLPATDVLRFGAGVLMDALSEYFS